MWAGYGAAKLRSLPERRRARGCRKATSGASRARDASGLRAVLDPRHACHAPRAGTGRSPAWPRRVAARSAPGSLRRTPGMDGQGKSDRLMVPWTPANKGDGAPSPAERVEERGLAKGNAARRRKSRTQSRSGVDMANPKRAPSSCSSLRAISPYVPRGGFRICYLSTVFRPRGGSRRVGAARPGRCPKP